MWISRTLAAAGWLAVASGVAPILMASAPDGPQPIVYLAEVDGIIHPVSAEYLQRSDRSGRFGGRGTDRHHAPDSRRARGLDAGHQHRDSSPRRPRSWCSSGRRVRVRLPQAF